MDPFSEQKHGAITPLVNDSEESLIFFGHFPNPDSGPLELWGWNMGEH